MTDLQILAAIESLTIDFAVGRAQMVAAYLGLDKVSPDNPQHSAT